MPTAAATLNAPMAEATEDTLSESDTLNVPFAANPRLRRHFAYSKQSLIVDNELFWHQHENIPPNVIGVFENDIMNRSAIMCHIQVQKRLTIQLCGTLRSCLVDFLLLGILFAPVLRIHMHSNFIYRCL